jgi:hypothetical protein
MAGAAVLCKKAPTLPGTNLGALSLHGAKEGVHEIALRLWT